MIIGRWSLVTQQLFNFDFDFLVGKVGLCRPQNIAEGVIVDPDFALVDVVVDCPNRAEAPALTGASHCQVHNFCHFTSEVQARICDRRCRCSQNRLWTHCR